MNKEIKSIELNNKSLFRNKYISKTRYILYKQAPISAFAILTEKRRPKQI